MTDTKKYPVIPEPVSLEMPVAGTLSAFLKNHKHFAPVPATDKHAWIQYEKHSVVKYPFFDFTTPSEKEIASIFKASKTPLISYSVSCSEAEANTWWYVCKDFDPQEIHYTFLKNIRKGQKSYTIKQLSVAELKESGYKAYADTRRRIGLSDFTREEFKNKYSEKTLANTHLILGAFNGMDLAAVMVLNIVNDFVEISGAFSRTDALPNRPNDLLVYFILCEFMHKRKYQTISYGFSSIQDEKEKDGLYQFKTKCGFKTLPIKRVFIVNPKYKFLINSSGKIISVANKLFPQNRMIRKIRGILKDIG